MRNLSRRRGLLLKIGGSSILGMAIWIGCNQGGGESASVPADTAARLPSLKECNKGQPPTTKEELDRCLEDLSFVREELQGDQQRLMVFDAKPGPGCPGARGISNCRLGPLARIEPEAHSHRWRQDDVEREGRIIAQMSVEGSEGYPKLALVPGHKTYWWVKPASGGGGISRYISDSVKADGKLYFVERKLRVYTLDRTESWKQAIARWIWLADDETSKGTCSSSSSCK